MRALVRRPRLAALVAAGLVVVLVFAATGLGLRLPGLGFLDLFGDRTELDYDARYLEEFAPLRDSFVDEQLGALAGAGGTSKRAAAAAAPPAVTAPIGDRVSVEHPPTNDAFADAYVVPSVPFTAKTSMVSATRESGEPAECAPLGGTLWYRYKPTEDLTLLANTFGTSYATTVGVFSGPSLAELKEVGCNVSARGDARVGFPARSGRTYYVQVAGPTSSGPLVFSLEILGRTTRVSLSSSGGAANGYNYGAAISGDGRRVVFHSAATNLVAGQRGCPPQSTCTQVFVRDLKTDRTEMVSVTPSRTQGNGNAFWPSISADGRYVGFASTSSDLTDPPTCEYNEVEAAFSSCPQQVFVRDLEAGVTRVASVSSKGQLGNGGSGTSSLSSDGRYIAFDSSSSNLAGRAAPCGGLTFATTSPCQQVYVHDFETGKTEMVSRSRDGATGNSTSRAPSISGDGRFVAFGSYATNLVPGDDDGRADVLVQDRVTRRMELVSSSLPCEPDCTDSRPPLYGSSRYISHDGRYVMFASSRPDWQEGTVQSDVSIRDRLRRTTVSVTVSHSNGRANGGPVGTMSISPDGRYVGFDSTASNLVPGDTNRVIDVFVRDMLRGKTVRVSVSSLGVQGDDISWTPSLSARGKVMAFTSTASNISEPYDQSICPTRNGIYCSEVYVHEGDPSI